MQYFDTIAPGEKNVLTFNMAPGLPAGATLTGTITCTVTTREGVDLNPSSILVGAPVFDGSATLILVAVAPTVDGTLYHIQVEAATTAANVSLALSALLPVSSN